MDKMDEKPHEACGVVGVYRHADAAKLTYLGLHALQHRGQESAGIACSDGQNIRVHKAMGLVSDVFNAKALASLRGTSAIGHTRYSTAGDSALSNAQPLVVNCNRGPIAVAHNGNLTNAAELRTALERTGAIFQTTSDTEVILHLIARSPKPLLEDAIAESLRQLHGAFSLVILTTDRIFAVRDPHGFRPLSIGRVPSSRNFRDAALFASETTAFDLIGAEFERDLQPGEMVIVSREGTISRRYTPAVQSAACIFELVYFARPDSVVFGRSVARARELMGRRLAEEAPANADLVVAVPDSGVPAAIGYSEQSGIPFRMGLIRSHYTGRTFIEPQQRVRDFGVKLKLNPVRSFIEGKRIVLIDDSVVRGTTSRKIIRMLRNAGAREVHVRVASPPYIAPCNYGIDTPCSNELIAANRKIEEICESIGADSLAYLSLPGLLQACEDPQSETFCTCCFTGKCPTEAADERHCQHVAVTS